MKKYTHKQVKQFFKNKNLKLLSEEYKNSIQKLNYKCLICGYIGTKKLKHLLESSMKCGCKKCSAIKKGDKYRYKLEEVKLIFKKNNMKLLSTEYNNNDEKLRYKCLKKGCGYIGEKILGNLVKGGGCSKCAIKKRTFTYKKVKDLFFNNNMKLLEKTYVNSKQKMKYQCIKETCGYIGVKTVSDLLQEYGCPRCAKVAKYTYKQVKKIFLDNNMKLLNKEYKNNREKLKYKCLNANCGHVGEKLLSNLLQRCGCINCYKLNNRGKNHHRYNPNLTDEERIRRRSTPEINEWRKKVYKRDSYTCQKCGETKGGSFNAHHRNSWKCFPEQRYGVENGVTFCKKCHKQFHSKYGIKKTTEYQTNLFLGVIYV